MFKAACLPPLRLQSANLCRVWVRQRRTGGLGQLQDLSQEGLGEAKDEMERMWQLLKGLLVWGLLN